MRVAVAFDHRGVKLRERVLEELAALQHEVVDLGTDSDAERVDYPDKALELGLAVRGDDAERGICHDVDSAHQGVEHDDMNVLCLGSEVVGGELALDLVRAFLGAEFDGGERYVARLQKIEAMERSSYD